MSRCRLFQVGKNPLALDVGRFKEVLAGPPNVTFKWRHWGSFTGSYKDYKPTGETIEITGISIARVTEDLKIESLEHYFDNNAFLEKLTAGGCPFHS
ncbi:putative pathogenesis protein [Nodularia spumigena CCY9414]|jgi:hypothetical protein|nr:putative pathogenesis protein [Nodularia spumigena CCY9414]EAW45037.1 pathogenesis related protein-like protein [Nodularia spumigena CCY9414]